ncbi:sushi, von Willebrand factor type A, EGF and pentraxin domain-containing protein 1-like [Ruditapes philippinarum]|uniref:sushi, von Willebrand factor type A, EGF and pentraxin domain-containing protein 1-like n=1 Tax=Ruditapes philippinarum TaxID=129788 RepID=UPI00295BDF7A|nr:sushi, von Willebrand factor type A, EGF and pentraxin domain-containing protein 1-like [Ruditapes philippinarum]
MENIMEISKLLIRAEVLSQSSFKDETCNCGLPSIPLQGSVTVTGTYFLDVATFSCEVGYDLVGSRQLMCENGGMWNGSYPTCSPKVTVSTTPNPTPDIDTTCGLDSLDVVFGIGVSDIMTESEFSSLKNFVFNAIHRSNIDFGITRFGFFLFNKEVVTESVIHLKQYRTRADLILAIDSIPFEPSSGPAYLAVGLQYLLTMFTAINGARTGISNMAVIMLDNNVDISNSSSIASQLKVSRISLQFMTVGYQNVTQLENMGSGETSVSNANSYGFLEWIVENGIYRDEICSCGGIENPDFGSVVVTGSYFLDVASFSCIDGYELIGSKQLVCQYDHVWSGTPPTCTRTGVVSPPGSHINPKTACGFSNADVVVGIATSSLTTETEFIDLISLVKTFIMLSDIDSGSTQFGFFMFDALVYTDNVIDLGEINITADLLAEVNNIPYTPYRSKTRFELGLNQVLEMFSAKVGRNRADVPDHVFILTGTDVLYYDVFSAANQIRDSGIMLHIIADGYNPVLSSLVFGADGHFIELPALDREAFIAQKLFRHSKCNCGEVFGPGNGSVNYKQAENGEVSTFYLDVATFTCDAGFQLVGSPQLVCQDGGNWAGTVPTCRSQGVTAFTSVKPTTPGQLVTDKECGLQNIDVVYGVGLSSDISETDFENIKNLIKIGIDHANIEMGSAQLGFFIYANGVTLMKVALGEYMTRSDIFSALDSFKYQKDNNQVSLSTGLNIARNMFSSLTNDAGAPDYLYMIMDHSVDIEGASEIVEQLRAADIHVDFIAVGLDHSSELHKFAHVEEVDSFDTTEMAVTARLLFRSSECNCSDLQSPDNGKVVYDDTYFLDVAAFSCNQGYAMVGSQQLVCKNRGVWSGSPPVCVPKGSKKEVDVLISLNMTTQADVDLKKNDTYNTYKEAVKLALEKHYRDLLKDDNVTIIINGLSFGSLNVNFTIVISNTAESVENFTKSTVNLAKGVSIEVLNESLAVTNMSVGENSVNIVTLTEEALTCMVFIEANGPCDLGYICQLVDDVPNCVPDPDTDCGFPGSTLNGKVLTVDGTLYGESATFSCNYGYRLEGNRTLICMPSGFWVPEVPTCTYIDCGNLTSPENGMVDLPGGTGYRQPANFSCYPGYTLVGQAELLCNEGSKWSGIAPTCQIDDDYCGAVLDPQHGSVWTTDLSRINSTATFICNNGYRMEGPGTKVCSGNTNWEPVQDTKCIIKDCGILRNPLNGSVDQSSGTTFGQTVVFSCSVGYKLFGADQATCMADGNWSATPPECQITNCGGLSNPANGLVSASQTTFGQRATYVCNPGYKIQGISTRTCQPDGSWSVREPTCLPLDCGALFDPNNGIVNTTSGTTFGNLATYSCNEGYKLEGQAVTECADTGIWNPSVAPKCDIIDCGQLQDLQYGRVTLSKGTRYQSVATYQCDTGYILKGPTTRECLYTEEWSNKQQQTSCSIIDCGSISQPMDGSVSLTNNTVYQSVAQFTCNNGYKLSGPISRTCSISGNWEPNQASSCSLQDCGRIQNPVNGNVDQSSGTTYGRTVHFNCSVGYEIFGSKQATCKADGQWSHAAPVCRITDCKGLPYPDNGTVSASETTFGQVASYTCNEGFTLQGTSSRFCQPDGSWSGSTPTCLVKDCGSLPDPAFGKVEYTSTVYGSEAVYRCNIGYSIQGLTTRKCEADRNWSGVTPTCTIIDCGSLSSVVSGSYTPPQRNTYNTAVIVSCNTGYQLNGNATVTCLETGQWSPLPTCTIRDCGELTEPENGLLSLPQGTTYGQTAVFTCKTGYILSGSTQLQCLQDGFWSGTPPTCRIADCGILNDPANGAVTLSGTSFGDYVTYVCDAGHQITGSPSRLCQETAEWSGSQPSCKIRDCGTLTAPAGGNVTLSGTKYGNVATFTCNTGYNVVGLSTLVCRADGFWSAEPPACSLQEGLLAKELIVTLNMTAPPGLTLSNPFTYEAYRKEVKVALEQHYGLRLKDNIIDIIINSMSLGSLIVDYTVVMKDKAEAVKNFSQASMELAQGSTIEVFNQNLGVDKMTANNDPEDLKSLQSDELVCRLFLDLLGPCQTGYVCTLVNDSPDCRPDPSIDCGIPPIPLNGELDYARGTLYGETVIYTCISGYTLTGANTRTCQVDGSWQPPAPTCSLTDCGSLNSPDNGRVIYGGTVIGQTAFFSCDAGYSLIGATVITCQLDGSWNNPPPSCAITGCGGLQSPLHGFVSISFDSRSAMYSCDTGYILNGDEIRNCLTSNVWSGITPTCKVIVCPLLPNPQYGSVTLSGTSFDDTATYRCTRAGYRLSGTDTRKCSDDGQWSARAPTCDIIECADLPDFPNGNMVMSGKTYGQTVSYTCNQGYILDGATTLKCEENGWSNSPPTCKLQGDCGPLQNPTYGYITFTLGTAYLSKATYVCYIGYKLTGNAERECQADNTWSGSSVTCVNVDCGQPPSPGEGQVSYGSGTTYGRVATYTCNSGYDLIGQTSVTCQNNGSWSNVPVCRPKDCGNLPNPLNGIVDTVTGTTFGYTALYTCNPGFYIMGVSARTCLATGFWDNLEPICTVRDCGPLATPTNGVVNIPSGTTFGQTATYICRPGYILSGAASRQCTVDGTWTDSPPICTAIKCVMPGNPGNGLVSVPSGVGVGSVATYSCNPGYVISPASNVERTCMMNGNWTASQPACIFVDCGSLSAPMFGDVLVDQTSFGHTATYICKQGYIIFGTIERTCSSDGTWSGTKPVCTVSDCGTLANPTNGEVKMPDGTLFGATAVYTCNSGYSTKDYYKRTCLSNGTWSRNAPTCQSSREFALAVGLGVGLTGFVILVLTIVLIIVILYRRNHRSKRYLRKPSRVYTLSQPLMAPSLPVKMTTSRPLIVPYYSGPTLMDDGVDEDTERKRTWRSRKADYGDPTNPLYYNSTIPRHEYYSFER